MICFRSIFNHHSNNIIKTISTTKFTTTKRDFFFQQSHSIHIDSAINNDGTFYRHNPFELQNAHTRKPLLPICSINLRIPGISGRNKHLGCAVRKTQATKNRHRTDRRPNNLIWNGGNTPLFARLPKWRHAIKHWRSKPLEWCSLRKVKKYLERGRLDARFPITQRHLNDSGLVRVKRGVRLYNTDDLPFPYRIHIEVAAADQSSIDVINAVGGSVTIVFRNKLNLEAHLHPGRFEILPPTARPDLGAIWALEKYRARGCFVHYIKPLWLIQEEEILKSELANASAENKAGKLNEFRLKSCSARSSLDEWKEQLLSNYRARKTYKRRSEVLRFRKGTKEEWRTMKKIKWKTP